MVAQAIPGTQIALPLLWTPHAFTPGPQDCAIMLEDDSCSRLSRVRVSCLLVLDTQVLTALFPVIFAVPFSVDFFGLAWRL